MKKIVLTGGGTAGHVTPNIALIPALLEKGYEISYIGTYNGIEKKLIEEIGIPYYGISSGKLRRYFDLKNFTDPFRVNKGFGDAKRILKKIKPDVVFSKGGFVTVPVVLMAAHLHIPVVIHESDMTPGLANKIAMRYADKICCTFPETIKYIPEDKAYLTGTPIRSELISGNVPAAYRFTGLSHGKPVILVVGGSTGAKNLNEAVRKVLPTLLEKFQVVHLCGEGKTDSNFDNIKGYVQFAYVDQEMKDLLAMADIVVSRAGANAIFELLSLKKPNLLVPLPADSSRGDQLLNADSFESQGYSMVLTEDRITPASFVKAIEKLYKNRSRYIEAMGKSDLQDAITKIVDLIDTV